MCTHFHASTRKNEEHIKHLKEQSQTHSFKREGIKSAVPAPHGNPIESVSMLEHAHMFIACMQELLSQIRYLAQKKFGSISKKQIRLTKNLNVIRKKNCYVVDVGQRDILPSM